MAAGIPLTAAAPAFFRGFLVGIPVPHPNKFGWATCPNVREARDLLQRALGLKVTIDDRGGRGKVIIEYSNISDFDELLETIEAARRR